jgi:hypothetical protein
MRRKKKKSIYDRYQQILKKPKLSDDEIDEMRKNIKLLALSLVEHVLKTKVDHIY